MIQGMIGNARLCLGESLVGTQVGQEQADGTIRTAEHVTVLE